MKKSKLFMAAGTLILAASAVFATKATKKFTLVATGYASGSGIYIHAPSAIWTVTAQSLKTAYLTIYTSTSGHLVRTKLRTVGNSKTLYY